MTKRNVILAIAIAAVIAAGALAGYWLWAAGQVRTAIAEWSDAQRAAGYAIAYGGPDIGGFPVRLSVHFAAPRVTAPQGWHWSGAAIAGQAAFWQPLSLRLALPLRQELVTVWRGLERTLSLQSARADGLVRLDGRGRAVAATVEMAEVTLREAAGWSARIGHMRHDISRPSAAPEDQPHTRLEGTIADLTLTQAPPPLPATIDRLAYAADLTGTLPPGEPAAALAAWRDGGGLLQVTNLTLIWGPLDVRADGTVALDALLRPEGAFAAHIAGLPEMLEALVARGIMLPGAAAALRIAVLTLSEGRDGSGRPTVRLPVTLQDGTIFLGPVALARVDPVL
jgi:hypothetical protein